MRKGLLYIAMLGMMTALAGCGGKTGTQNPQTNPTDKVGESTESKDSQEVVGEEMMAASYLTGLPIKVEDSLNRPLAVMINNIKAGCPQSGIADAAIIYEAPVEGRITRLMAIYDDYTNLEKVGSIRSSRDYFVYFALEYDAIYAHFGQATPYVGELLNGPRVDNISGAVAGIKRPATNTFYDEPGRKAPHQKYLNSERLLKDIEKFDYRTYLRADYTAKFQFETKDSPINFENAEDVTVIYPGGKTSDRPNGFSYVEAKFEYNEEDKKYYRYQYGGEHIDELTGEQLAYDNVIFQYCHGEVRDDEDYLAFGCHGDEGMMVRLFTQGKMITGTWSKMTNDGPASYVDEDGNPMILSPGKTWICIIWDKYGDDVVFE